MRTQTGTLEVQYGNVWCICDSNLILMWGNLSSCRGLRSDLAPAGEQFFELAVNERTCKEFFDDGTRKNHFAPDFTGIGSAGEA